MTAILEKIKPFTTLIKTVFFISILVLIIAEMVHLKRTISLQDLQAALVHVPAVHIVGIFLVGLLAIVPITGYDFILNRILKTDHSKSYIFQTSWCISTFNNISGFGGLIDIGLRLAFYGQKDEEERDLQQVTNFLPYLISGLSFISLISLGLIWSYGDFETKGLPYFSLFLIGASAYFPILYWFTGRTTRQYFGSMTSTVRKQLGLVSFLEWLCAALAFYAIGQLMGIDFPLHKSLPLFSVGCIVGIISLIPGGLGSFDFIVLTGMTAQGLPKETALAWLLLYRLAYYVLPFLIGIIFFVKHLGRQINQRYQAVPKELFNSLIHKLLVNGVRILGVCLVLSTVFFDNVSQVAFLAHLKPMVAQLIWQFPGLFLGVCFVFLARTIEQKIKRSFALSVVWLIVSFLYVNVGEVSFWFSLGILLLFLCLVLVRPQLYKEQFIYSWESGTKDTLFISLTLVALFALADIIIPAKIHLFNGHFSPIHYLLTWRMIALLTGIVVLAYWILVRIVQAKKIKLGEPFQHERYVNLLRTCGGSADSGLAFLGNKRLFWYQKDGKDQLAFQMVVKNNKALIMGEPAGNHALLKEGIRYLIDSAETLDYDLIFYSIGQDLTLYLHEFGFDFMKVGEDALVDLEMFSMTGNKGKAFRNALNRVKKEGFSFEVVEAPHDKALLQDLKGLSDAWLHQRSEYRFSLGYFDEAYFQEAPLALVRNETGKLVAFANIMPNYQEKIATIDLMRYDPEQVPNGIMDFLFLSLFVHFQEEGKHYFDLGMAPLSGVGQVKESFIQERIAYLVYHLGSYFYSFEGLYRYKDKFRPDWQGRYLSFSRTSWIAYVMLILLLADRKADK